MSAEAAPSCSIIIPSHRRPAQLERCLDALTELDYPEFEIVVVDDGGGIDLTEALAGARRRVPVTVHVQAQTGPAGARNAGARLASGEVLAFTDDDCRPARDWLARLVDALSADGGRGAGGHTVNVLTENLFAGLSQLVIDVGYEQNNGSPGAARFFTSNNLVVPKSGFESIGGFDTAFITSEDRDFCDRWIAHGYSLTYVPDAIVYHAHDLTMKRFIRQHFAYGRGAARYHAAHARRWNRRVTVEPSFYRKLFVAPFRRSKGRRVIQQVALLQFWNAINTAGFAWELLHPRGVSEATRTPIEGRTDLRSGSSCDVLHVVWPGSPSGVVTQVAGLVRAASHQSGLTHRICFLDGEGSTGDALEAEGLVTARLGLRRGWGPVGLLRFARSLRKSNPRVVHFHWPALGPIFVAMATLPGSSFVWTEHHPGALFRSFRFRAFYRLFRHRFASFVVAAESMAACVESYGVDPRRIALIPNGLTIERRPPVGRRERKGYVVGVVTRLGRLKELELFIEVVAELVSRGVDCTGVIVGDGRQRAQLEGYADTHGRGVIRFVGMKDDVTSYLDDFDLFLTTTSIESFGLAALEAMARAVPVVAMPCPGGLADLVARGGVLLADRSIEGAANVVQDLLASPEVRESVAARGYELTSEFELEATRTALDRLYLDLIEAPGSVVPAVSR